MDKTTNLYKLDKTQCDKLLHDSIASAYKKADDKVIDTINLEAKELAMELDIGDKIKFLAKQQPFLTLNDHKKYFKNAPTCHLINPAKSEMGPVSKQILKRNQHRNEENYVFKSTEKYDLSYKMVSKTSQTKPITSLPSLTSTVFTH